MSTHFGDLEELIEFGLSNDGSHLFDQQQTEAVTVEQQHQQEGVHYQFVVDSGVVGNDYNVEVLQNADETYQEGCAGNDEDDNTLMEESRRSFSKHYNNNNIFDPGEFLILPGQQQQEQHVENSIECTDENNDINGLEEHLLEDDNEMLTDDIIFEDQMTALVTAKSPPSPSSTASSGTFHDFIKIEPGVIPASTTASASNSFPLPGAFETRLDLENIEDWIKSTTPSKYKVIPEYVDDDDKNGKDYNGIDENGMLHDLNDDTNETQEDIEIETEDISMIDDDDLIIEERNVIELETISMTGQFSNEDNNAVVPVSLIKTTAAVNSPTSPKETLQNQQPMHHQKKLLQEQQKNGKNRRIPLIETPPTTDEPSPKRKSIEDHKGPLRYMLFDDLIATIVEFDADETPIVEFSMSTSKADIRLPIECGICPEVMSRAKLSAHLKTHLVPETNRYVCIYCDETYRDCKYLAGHARRHMGIRPYVCSECKLYFSTKQDLRVHNQRRHIEKEHTCEICGKNFAQNTQLKRHRESMHEKKRRFKCSECPKAYYKNFSLQEHIRNVHMGERRMLVCPFCGMQCRDAHKMSKHRKENHLNKGNYVCHVCCEEFTDINYFDAHKRSIQCRSNTRRQLVESNYSHSGSGNDVGNKETTATASSTNTRRLKDPNRHDVSCPASEQQLQLVNKSFKAIVDEVLQFEDADDEDDIIIREEDQEINDDQNVLVESLLEDQDDIIYEVTLGSTDDDVADDNK